MRAPCEQKCHEHPNSKSFRAAATSNRNRKNNWYVCVCMTDESGYPLSVLRTEHVFQGVGLALVPTCVTGLKLVVDLG